MLKHLLIIETILRDREAFFGEIRDGVRVREKIQSMLIACAVFLALYGLAMGMKHSPYQAVASLVKLPDLFLFTLLICAPSLHFFNILFGSKQTMSQSLALILTAIAVSSVLLFSLAPITLFFLLTSSQYQFFKLLNVVFFVIAGFLGVSFLRRGLRIVADSESGVGARRLIFSLWVLLYGFVGSQMAWTLRPFVGDPTKAFILFLKPGGNIYADVLRSIGEVLGF